MFDGFDDTDRIAFGAFELAPGARTLRRHGQGVTLGGRAFDVLVALARAPGRVVSKAELMRRVWPRASVEEANLRAQLRYLREALGPERWRVKTIPGRGYLLSLASTPLGGSDIEAASPVVVIAAGAALRALFPREEAGAWSTVRITAACPPQTARATADPFAALAACLEAAGASALSADPDAAGALAFPARVLLWRSPQQQRNPPLPPPP